MTDIHVARTSSLSVLWGTEISPAREENQDCVRVYAEQPYVSSTCRGPLIAVADGMGGHRAGAIAAKMTVDQLFLFYQLPSRGFQPRRTLERLLRTASLAVRDLGETSEAHRSMGATVSTILFDCSMRHFLIAQVGDSPAYHFRGDEVRFFLAPHFEPKTGHLLARIGMRGNLPIHILTGEVEPGDRFVLCTDGVFTAMDDEAFTAVMRPSQPAWSGLEEVMKTIQTRGKDNGTLVVVDVLPTPDVP